MSARLHQALIACLFGAAGAAVANAVVTAIIMQSSALDGIVKDGTIITLCALCVGQEHLLHGRRTALQRRAEALDIRERLLGEAQEQLWKGTWQ